MLLSLDTVIYLTTLYCVTNMYWVKSYDFDDWTV